MNLDRGADPTLPPSAKPLEIRRPIRPYFTERRPFPAVK